MERKFAHSGGRKCLTFKTVAYSYYFAALRRCWLSLVWVTVLTLWELYDPDPCARNLSSTIRAADLAFQSPYATSKLKRFGDYPTDLKPKSMPTRMELPV